MNNTHVPHQKLPLGMWGELTEGEVAMSELSSQVFIHASFPDLIDPGKIMGLIEVTVNEMEPDQPEDQPE